MYNLHTIYHHSIYQSNSTIEFTWFKSLPNGLWYGYNVPRFSISKQTCYTLHLSWTTKQSAWILFVASFDFQNIHIYLSNYKWWKPSYSLERYEKLSSIKIRQFCSFLTQHYIIQLLKNKAFFGFRIYLYSVERFLSQRYLIRK